MGCNTDFSGELLFTYKLSDEEKDKLESFLGNDCRDHPEWETGRTGFDELTWIDLKYNDDESGICWNGSEKTYDLAEKVELILTEMRKEFPDFCLEGTMMAQGERMEDRWCLVVENGHAFHRNIVNSGKTYKCPSCGENFIVEDL